MDNGFASCSPLYVRMRNAVVARPQRNVAAGGDVPMTELQRRLHLLSSSLAKGTAPHLPAVPSGIAVPSSASIAGMSNPAVAAATAYGGAGGAQMNPQYVQQAEADEEALRVPDILPVRVIELEDTVELRANTDANYSSTEGRPPNMDLVCANARVKIFQKYVCAARADSGDAVAELVLEELFQLSEDEETCSLTFFLGPKPSADGRSIAASTIVEFRCQTVEQLRCLYRIVSIRRSGVEMLKAMDK